MNDRFTNVFVKPFCKWTRKRYIISLLVKKKKLYSYVYLYARDLFLQTFGRAREPRFEDTLLFIPSPPVCVQPSTKKFELVNVTE